MWASLVSALTFQLVVDASARSVQHIQGTFDVVHLTTRSADEGVNTCNPESYTAAVFAFSHLRQSDAAKTIGQADLICAGRRFSFHGEPTCKASRCPVLRWLSDPDLPEPLHMLRPMHQAAGVESAVDSLGFVLVMSELDSDGEAVEHLPLADLSSCHMGLVGLADMVESATPAEGTSAASADTIMNVTFSFKKPTPSLGSLAKHVRSLTKEAINVTAASHCVLPWVDTDRQLALHTHSMDIGESGGFDIGQTMLVTDEATLRVELRSVASAQTKVVATVSDTVGQRLNTTFLPLIVAFIKNVVIPEFLVPPIEDGLLTYMGPTIAYLVIAPLVQGIIEAGSPKITNLLGLVCGKVLGLLMMMKLTVMLAMTLSDACVGVIASHLNRAISRGVIAFVNAHLLTTELFMIMHETNEKVSVNVIARLTLSLTHALTHTVTHSVTHSILHHYYCIYCYFYGNFCDFCYYYNDLTYMHRLWGFGQGHSEGCVSSREVPGALEGTTANLEEEKKWVKPG